MAVRVEVYLLSTLRLTPFCHNKIPTVAITLVLGRSSWSPMLVRVTNLVERAGNTSCVTQLCDDNTLLSDAMIQTADVWRSPRMSPMSSVTASRGATWCPIMFLVLKVRSPTLYNIYICNSPLTFLHFQMFLWYLWYCLWSAALCWRQLLASSACVCVSNRFYKKFSFHDFLISDTQYQRKRMGMLRVKLQGANRFMWVFSCPTCPTPLWILR